MKRISYFGLALSLSSSVVACATPDETDTFVRDTGGSGDTTISEDTGKTDGAPTDVIGDTKKDGTVGDTTPPEKCTPPLSDKRACGKCGTQSRLCSSDGTWGAWGACGGEDPSAECAIGEKRTTDCGNCGKQNDTCDNTTCTWNSGSCTGEGECAAGEIKVSTASCTVPGEVRTLVCTDKCKFPDVLSVPCSSPKGWVAMASAPTGMDGRCRHSAVWTGTEMIVWGGSGNYVTSSYGRNNGAAYDLAKDTWRIINQATLPSAMASVNGRYDHTAVWTGSAMLVWGGMEYSSVYHADGGNYDPVGDKWKALSSSPLAARAEHAAIWSTTTNEMIVWGGLCSGTACSDGASYDPVTDKWTMMPPSPIGGRFRHIMVWTGTELIIWGGQNATTSGYLKDGARYDPKTKVWTKFPDPLADIDGRSDHVGVWSGKELLIYGGWGSPTYGRNTGARYLPGGSWTSFTPPSDTDWGTGGGKRYAALAWAAGGKLYMFGGGATSTTAVGGGTIYDPAKDSWTALDTTDALTSRARGTVVWTGKEAILWGGNSYPYYPAYSPPSPSTSGTWYADGKIFRP